MKKLFVFLFLLSSAICYGQHLEPKTEKARSVNFDILGLQYNHEIPLSRLMTVNFHGGLGSDLMYWQNSHESEWAYSFRGVAGADFRYFYNLGRRAAKGKNTRLNTGNFFSVDMLYITPAIYSKNIYPSHAATVALSYGARRVYKSGWLIESCFGYMAGYSSEGWGRGIKLNFKVGYSF